MDYRSEAPEIIKGFLNYHGNIKGHSKLTVDEYYLDLRTFFRYMKIQKNLVPRDTNLGEISIKDIDLDFVRSVTLNDVYDYLNYLSRDREKYHNSENSALGLSATSRARKISTIRSFYKYLTLKAKVLDVNPIQDLDSPKIMKALPKYLTEEEAVRLLVNVDGPNKQRDYCILTIFLNCGLRISELVGLDLSSYQGDHLRVLGKGNKERLVYLNEACINALEDYLEVRNTIAGVDTKALFLSSRRQRISTSTVHSLVKKHLGAAGLDTSRYSAHKLRHTAATLMLHNGVDVRTLQELLGHEHLNTTEIYTHVENSDLRNAAQLSPLANLGVVSQENRGEPENKND